MEAERQSLRAWISDGLIIAIMTATAYVWALAHEVGFCGYFHIPFCLISLSPAKIFTVSGGIILVTYFMILVFILPGIIFSPIIRYATRSVLGITILTIDLLLLFFVPLLVFGIHAWRQWILIGVFIVSLLLLLFVRPLFTQRGKGSYREKLAAELEESQQLRSSRPQPSPHIIDFMGVLGFFVFVCIGIYGAYDMGRTTAQGLREFIVLPESPDVP